MITPRKLTLLLAVGIAVPSAAELNFLYALQVPSGVAPYCVEVLDVDGDGDRDIVTGNIDDDGPNSISVIKNLGNKQFAAPVAYPVGEDPMNISSGDFNGDGKLDLVVANTGSGTGSFTTVSTVSVLINQGNGVYGAPQNYGVGENARPEDVEVADFNNDGILDFAVATSIAYDIHIFRGVGNGTFTSAGSFYAEGAQGIDVADFNRDGRMDIVYANIDAVQLMRNTGTSFVPGPYISNFPTGSNDVVAGDFNGDGAPDFATSGRSMTVFMNNGTGTSFGITRFAGGESQMGIDGTDFDGDGDFDIVTANYLANSASVYVNNGSGGFALRRDWGTGPNPWGIGIGDLDNDSKVDIVAPNSQLSQEAVTVIYNITNAFFHGRRDYGVTGYARGVEIADFNLDGHPDVVTGVYVSNQDNVAVFYGTATGDLQDASYLQNLGNNIPTDVAVGNFNGDTFPDIVTSIFSPGNSVRVFMNNANGTFAQSVIYAAGGNPSGVTTGDLNNDGRDDIICTNGSQLDSSISVFLNNGNGTFAPQIRIQVLLRPNDVEIGDLDNDGDRDVVVMHAGDDRILLFRNAGDGNLGTPEPINVGSGQGGAKLRDMNNDGTPDIVLAAGVVRILFNNGSASFTQQSTPIPAGRLAVADFDNDGDLDLTGTNFILSEVNVGENNGSGTFSLVDTFFSGYEPDRVAAGDIDHDGMADILTANGRSRSVSFFKNVTDAGLTVLPTSYVLNPGILVSGNLASLEASDDNRMVMRPGPVFTTSQYPIAVVAEGTSPSSSPQSMRLVVESSASAASIVQSVEVFNFATGQYDPAVIEQMQLTDVSRTYTIATPAAHVGPANLVRARVRYRANGPVFAYPWNARLDTINWRF